MQTKPKLALLKAISQSKLTELHSRPAAGRPPEIPPALVPVFITMCTPIELAHRAEAFKRSWSPLND